MLLSINADAKTVKGTKKGYLTGILYLKPQLSGGYRNLCPSASEGCILGCLNEAGRGGMYRASDGFNAVQAGRQRKTDMYFNEMPKFFDELKKDIQRLVNRAKKLDLIPCVRLNGTSDVPSIARKMAKVFPDVQFYDYTKLPNPQKRTLPNYHLTFSRSENNWSDCVTALENGISVAVVFNGTLPETYLGYTVKVGDETDLRFLDGVDENGKGFIIGLTAKGKAKKDKSGFVVEPLQI